MDLSAHPCEDFFRFTCGNFEVEHPRPDSQTSHDWFTEKQSKVLRDIKKKLQSTSINSEHNDEPDAVVKAKMLFKSCLNSALNDKLQFDPLFRLLGDFGLPKLPSIIENPTTNDVKLQWIKIIAKVKRSLGVDILMGFDVFTDPMNRTHQYLAFGTPSQEDGLPLIDDILAKRLRRVRRKISSSVEAKKQESSDYETEGSEVVLAAYATYMKEVISAITMKTNAAELYAENILNAIKVTIDISREVFIYVERAENASKAEIRGGNVSELVYIKVADLQKIIDDDVSSPSSVLETYLTEILSGIKEAQFDFDNDVILTSKADILYLKLVMKLIYQLPPIHLEMFIWWSVVEDLILYTTTSMRHLYYDYSKAVTGVDGAVSRQSYCSATVNKLMGFAVSYLILEDDFMIKTKPKVEKMLHNIRMAFENLVRHATWMDLETKESTLKKSQRMKSLIGFPDWILNKTSLESHYEPIKIKNDTWMKNIVELLTWSFVEKLSKWRMKHEFEWATSPTNVNAFHTFQANAITIPLAILQFPFYQLGLEALNYGSIGSILAHELTHGFDDIGRHFDEEGNKNYWWTETTVKNFVNRTECFKKQYSNYILPDIGEYINGETTLGENIADNGGVREAYYAYNYYVQSVGKEQKLPGTKKYSCDMICFTGFESYSHEQMFFISYGNLWCETMTESGLRFALDDTHCPGRIRLLGALSNFKEFHKAFECYPGQKYHKTKDETCIIW
ncbi:CLUMA_CG005212, isoform A [Clunio marinus]|uniref:CLUMA_CG005212, isoform A n=1 Tax=Clunio marinus TaxID=568069 RepID=A0A1J1HU77_9DIPT|nr:CLUMA_CG005212, isoform A [Clunio marinus]